MNRAIFYQNQYMLVEIDLFLLLHIVQSVSSTCTTNVTQSKFNCIIIIIIISGKTKIKPLFDKI